MEELGESLQELLKTYIKKVQKRRKSLGGIKTSNVRIPPYEKQKGDKVPEEETTKINADIVNLEEALKGENVEDIKEKLKTLYESSAKVKEFVMDEPKQEPKKEEKKKDDNVVDAEFEEVDNKE